MASLGTADGTAACKDASGRNNAVQIKADLIGSAEEGVEPRVEPVQADAADAVSQASNSLIPLPAKHLSNAATVKKKVSIRVAIAHAYGS